MAKQGLSQDFQEKLIKNTLIALGVGTVALGGLAFYNKNKAGKDKKKALADIATNPNTSAASLIRHGVNPSGTSWLMWTDGSDEDLIFRGAQSITDFQQAISKYEDIYNSDMLADLQEELSPSDYEYFLSLATTHRDTPSQESRQRYLYNINDSLYKTGMYANIYSDITSLNVVDTVYSPWTEMIVKGRNTKSTTHADGYTDYENFYLVEISEVFGENTRGWVRESNVITSLY